MAKSKTSTTVAIENDTLATLRKQADDEQRSLAFIVNRHLKRSLQSCAQPQTQA